MLRRPVAFARRPSLASIVLAEMRRFVVNFVVAVTDGNDAADAEDAPARTACAGESPAPSDILKYAFGGWGRLCERPPPRT